MACLLHAHCTHKAAVDESAQRSVHRNFPGKCATRSVDTLCAEGASGELVRCVRRGGILCTPVLASLGRAERQTRSRQSNEPRSANAPAYS